MVENEFALRLAKLRTKKDVSAREMSLSIGQNAGYINNIETGKALPSMSTFFFICEYLNISPRDFFDLEAEQPKELRDLIDKLKKLTPKQLDIIASVVSEFIDTPK